MDGVGGGVVGWVGIGIGYLVVGVYGGGDGDGEGVMEWFVEFVCGVVLDWVYGGDFGGVGEFECGGIWFFGVLFLEGFLDVVDE